MLMMSGVTTNPRPVEPQVELQLHHGVYFRPSGEVAVTGSDWTVCTSIHLASYEEAHTSLTSQISQMEEGLRELEGSASRGDTGKQKLTTSLRSVWNKLLLTLKQDLQNYNSDIEAVKRATVQDDARTARGLINVVSDVGKYLFGFSTEKDVSDISAKIEQLASQQQNIVHVNNQQFSFIKSVATQALDNGRQVTRLESSLQGMAEALQEYAETTNSLALGAKFTTMGLEYWLPWN